jgi:hypothetical protein
MKRTYQRSQVLYFHELNSEQQLEAIDTLGESEAQEESFVLWNNDALPLSMFMRIEKGLFTGVYGQSYFSAYFIKLNNTGEAATVVYSHW